MVREKILSLIQAWAGMYYRFTKPFASLKRRFSYMGASVRKHPLCLSSLSSIFTFPILFSPCFNYIYAIPACPLFSFAHNHFKDAFSSDPALAVIPSTYRALCVRGVEFPPINLDEMAPVHTPSQVCMLSSLKCVIAAGEICDGEFMYVCLYAYM